MFYSYQASYSERGEKKFFSCLPAVKEYIKKINPEMVLASESDDEIVIHELFDQPYVMGNGQRITVKSVFTYKIITHEFTA